MIGEPSRLVIKARSARLAAGAIPSLLQRQPDLEDQVTYLD
jgi:hypothetical protein